MRLLTLTLFTLAIVLAVPATAAPADDAPAALDAVPAPTAQVAPDAFLVVEAPYTPADAGKIQLGVGDPIAPGSCSAQADCAGGGSVSCTASSGSCWFLDGCYAVCNGSYHWCGYRPNPCPV